MNKAALKSVILEQNAESRFLAEWVVREKLADVKPFLRIPHAVIISGIRRTGKSTLLAQILESTTRYSKEHVCYLSFEDERLLEFTVRDFQKLLEICIELYGHRKIFFLDEIQNIPQWEVFIRRMMERGYKFFITGSNASMLSKELGTRLTGRFVMIELLPFSFREYLVFQFSQNEGRYLENLVYIELKRRVSSKDIFYYKTKQNYEIDFLIRENNRITLLAQVTYQMHEKTTREGEIKALVSAMEETDCQSGIILTLDQQEEITVQGKKIKVVPVYQWLLLKH